MQDGLIQFLGSLVAIVALVLIARWLRLGGTARIADEAEARELADSAVCGFSPSRIDLDASGEGALLHDGEGRIMLLAPHGMHFSARLLTGTATAVVEGDVLVVRSGERWVPPARLRLSENAGYWS
ncbi:MAG TPA: hypothetical protein VK913_05270, partial [Erythrobacter sp.]|nr:hypothetical protein [Erythrobacter sp.]